MLRSVRVKEATERIMTIHLKEVRLFPERYPTKRYYPFNLEIYQQTRKIEFSTPVTFFVGENGAGKSTLLRAISHKCGIHIWEGVTRTRFEKNPYEDGLYRALEVQWVDGPVPGSFFASEQFQNFSQLLDEWADETPDILDYFGGKSLMTQSHGQSILSFFKARYERKGLYFMDEPETALSPRSQIALLELLEELGKGDHAQFIIATHSPILLACPDAVIYNFDTVPVGEIDYEQTNHYRLYRDFFKDREKRL